MSRSWVQRPELLLRYATKPFVAVEITVWPFADSSKRMISMGRIGAATVNKWRSSSRSTRQARSLLVRLTLDGVCPALIGSAHACPYDVA